METTNTNKSGNTGKNNTTLYQFVIDRSGSMSGLEQMVVGGYNEHLSAVHASKMLNIRRENVRNYNKSEYGMMSKSVDKNFMRYAESKSNGSFGKQAFEFFLDEEENS